jgi:hypothetical protein
MTEDVRGQKTEDRRQKTENRGQKTEIRCQRTNVGGRKLDLGFRKFDWKAQIGEAENRLTHRSRNMQREMKEIIKTQPNV